MQMSVDKVRIRASLPFNLPFRKEDIYSFSFSDFIARINETLSSTVPTRQLSPSKLTPDKVVIPVDAIVPVFYRKTPVNFSRMTEEVNRFGNSILISSADPNAIWALDVLFEKLFKTNSISIMKKSTYYCDFCKTQLSNRDVHMKKDEYRILYAKVKISENTYFIHSGLEDVVLQLGGININPYSSFVIQNLGNERWIMQKDIFEKLKEKTLIFPSRVEEKKGNQILSEFKDVKITSLEKIPTKFLSPNFSEEDAKLIGDVENVEVEIIDHDIIEGNVPHCNYCGKRVTKKRSKGVYVKIGSLNFNIFPKDSIKLSKNELLISKDFKNFSKIPLLECDRCGKIEYGQVEKPCTCGGMMRRNYSYDPTVLPIGVYAMVQSLKNRGIINHREFRHRFLMLSLISELRANFFSDIFISYADLGDYEKFSDSEPEILRLSFISKMHGKIHENDIRRYSKLRNTLLNILNYRDIYGLRENENITDLWIYSRIEKFKIGMEKFIENYNFGRVLREYESLIKEISKSYLKINRKEKMNINVFNEILIISYPFFPRTIFSYSQKNQVNLNDFKVGKFSVNEMVERLFSELGEARREIINIKMKKGFQASYPLKKLILEVEFKHLPLLLNIKQNLLRYFNANSIEITDKWKGLEYKVKLRRENLGEIYKPLANVIENVLSKIDAKKMKEEIEKHSYEIGVEGNLITITSQMVEFRYELPKNYEMIDLPHIKVFIEIIADQDTEKFNVIRKLSRRVAFMKKKLSVEYDDYIDLSLSDSKLLREIMKPYTGKLMEDLKIRKINFSDRFREALVMSFNDILEGEIDVGISPVFKKYKVKAISKLPGISSEDAEKIFSAGFYTLKDIEKTDHNILAEKTGLPLLKIKVIKDYIANHRAFSVVEIKGRYYCPLCETEIGEKVNICPRCSVNLEWPNSP